MTLAPDNRSSKPIWAGCLGLIVGAFLFGFLGLLLGLGAGGSSSGSGLQEVLVDGEASAEKKIAVIPIKGVIMETMGAGKGSVSSIITTLKQLKEDKQVVGILLAIDTPGGGVTASDRIYHALKTFKQESKLPMHAFFLDVAASGGYYAAMASDHITAHPTSITGSIGVISTFYNVSDAMDTVGVRVKVVKSLNSKGEVSFKDMGSPYRPMRPEEEALVQNLVSEMWERFTEVVAEGRKGKLELEQIRDLADGRIFTGKQALELKLVDAVGYREDAFASIRKACNAPEAKLVAYQKQPGLRELLGFSASSQSEVLWPGSKIARKILSDRSGFCYLWTAGEF